MALIKKKSHGRSWTYSSKKSVNQEEIKKHTLNVQNFATVYPKLVLSAHEMSNLFNEFLKPWLWRRIACFFHF